MSLLLLCVLPVRFAAPAHASRCAPAVSPSLNLNSVRESYRLACADWERKSLCEAFERKAVEQVRSSGGDPVARGFRATAALMMCQFLAMPWDQYRGFVHWRDELDAAVAGAPQSADLRLLRYGVAKNVPVFLGYREHLVADRAAVEAALRKGVWAGSPAFENFVRATLKAQ